MLDTTQELLGGNRRLLEASYAQIAWSWRLLNPWCGISGGSADDALDEVEGALYHHVRARLQRHTLPPAPKVVFAGRATVHRVCVICGRRIRPGSIQHESVAMDGRKDWSHTLCLRVWVDATVGLAFPTRSERQ